MSQSYREMQKTVVQMLCGSSGIHQSCSLTHSEMRHYTENNAMGLTSVVFPEPAVAQYIYENLISPLEQIEPCHYFYSPEKLHVTIKNIRTAGNPPLFTDNDIVKADMVFRDTVPRHKPFSFSFEEIVSLHTGVSMIGYCDHQLGDLVSDIDKGLNKTGLPDNKYYISNSIFFGNITLCRYMRDPSAVFLEKIQKMKNRLKQEINIETICLITCNTVCSEQSRKIINSYKLAGI